MRMTQSDAISHFTKGLLISAPAGTTFRVVDKPGTGLGGYLSDFNIEVVVNCGVKRFGIGLSINGAVLEDVDGKFFEQHGYEAGTQAQRKYVSYVAGYDDFDQFYNAGFNIQFNDAPERSKVIIRNDLMTILMKEKYKEESRRMLGYPPLPPTPKNAQVILFDGDEQPGGKLDTQFKSEQRAEREAAEAQRKKDTNHMSKLTDFLGGLGAHDDDENKEQKPLISEDMLEKWSPEQVERGNAIRAAAKAFARIKIQEEAAAVAFIEAIKASAPETVDEDDDSDMQKRLRLVAAARRTEAIEEANRHASE
jgi:hypothetical protein